MRELELNSIAQVTGGSIDGQNHPWSLSADDGGTTVRISYEDSAGNMVDTHYMEVGSTNYGGFGLSIGLGAGVFTGGEGDTTGGLYGGLGYAYNFGHASTLDELNSYLDQQADNMFCIIICNDIGLDFNGSLNPADWDWSGSIGVGILVPLMTETRGQAN